MVADALIYHPTVSHYLKFIATVVGRDKFLRVIQYFTRFYAWYLYRTNTVPSTIAPYTATKTQLGFIRKSMRLGKFVEHFRLASQAYDAKAVSTSDSFLKFCTVGRQLGYAGYMLFDNLTFLDTAGIRRSDGAKKAQKQAYQAWMVGLTFSAVAGVYKLALLRSKASNVDREKGEGVVESKRLERERRSINLQLLSDLCDLTVPSFAMGYGTSVLDDGVVGLAGTVSSLIGLHAAWEKTA